MVSAARGYFPAGHLVKKRGDGWRESERVTSYWAACKHSVLLADTKNSAPCKGEANSKADKTVA